MLLRSAQAQQHGQTIETRNSFVDRLEGMLDHHLTCVSLLRNTSFPWKAEGPDELPATLEFDNSQWTAGTHAGGHVIHSLTLRRIAFLAETEDSGTLSASLEISIALSPTGQASALEEYSISFEGVLSKDNGALRSCGRQLGVQRTLTSRCDRGEISTGIDPSASLQCQALSLKDYLPQTLVCPTGERPIGIAGLQPRGAPKSGGPGATQNPDLPSDACAMVSAKDHIILIAEYFDGIEWRSLPDASWFTVGYGKLMDPLPSPYTSYRALDAPTSAFPQGSTDYGLILTGSAYQQTDGTTPILIRKCPWAISAGTTCEGVEAALDLTNSAVWNVSVTENHDWENLIQNFSACAAKTEFGLHGKVCISGVTGLFDRSGHSGYNYRIRKFTKTVQERPCDGF